MGRCRFVEPEIVRLELSDGDWIEVRKYLTRGELVDVVAAVSGEVSPTGYRKPNVAMAGLSMVMAYLTDWSFRDKHDKPVPVDTPERRKAALNNLSPADYREIEEAVDRHIAAMAVELGEKKRTSDIA